MHNPELDEIFFVTQFMKGLKQDLQGPVMCQVPATVNRAVLLAKLLQEVLEKSKFRSQKGAVVQKHNIQSKFELISGAWGV